MDIYLDGLLFRVEYYYDHDTKTCELEELYMPGSTYNCIEWLSPNGLAWFEELIAERNQH